MANVVALIKDERVRHQVETLFAELNLPDLRTAFFGSIEEFEQLYLHAPTADPAPASTELAETELRLFSEINLFIYALDSIGPRTNAQWIERLRNGMKPLGFWPATGLRLVLLKYEDDNVAKVDLVHPALDDLIYLPIDRLTFLQKMQILLTLPKRATPTFLFNQTLARTIEISKITKLDRLSDVGLGIRNPVPLKRGLPSHFYLMLPNEREAIEVKGKVLRSEPHPDHPGQFLVYFSFFGLTKASLVLIRRSLQKDSHYKSLLHDDRGRFAFRADDLFLTDADKHRFGVVIVDRDLGEAMQLADQLRHDMDRLELQLEASYSLFLHRYLDHEAGPQDPPRATTREDFYAAAFEVALHLGDQRVLHVTPAPGAEDLALGYRAADLTTDPTVWTRLAADRGMKLILEEAAVLIAAGKPFEKIVSLVDAAGARAAVGLTLKKTAAEGVISLSFKPASPDEITAHASANRRHDHLEALIVEAAIVPPDPHAWVEGLRTKARELGLTTADHDLKFWIVNDRDEVNEAWLNTPEICGLMRKPVDHRELLCSLSEHLPNPNTVFNFGNLGWSQPGLNLHVSKPIALEALSEYGATLRSAHRLAPGSMFYLRKSIFDNAPNRCLAARVYACEEHPTTEGEFQVFVLYWGINDAFLKFARTWIRENYASSKQEG